MTAFDAISLSLLEIITPRRFRRLIGVLIMKNETMYNRIESLCKERGTNITAMCRELEIARSSLSELKQGRTKSLSYEYISKIARYFGVESDYIAGKSEYKNKPLVNEDAELTEYLEQLKNRSEMRMLFQLAKGATKDDVEKAVKIVEAFLKNE